MINHFPATGLETKILNRFLALKSVANKEEFKNVLDDATRIFDRTMISKKALATQFIAKMPMELKVHKTQSTWKDFEK